MAYSMPASVIETSSSVSSWRGVRVFVLLAITYITSLRVSGELHRIPTPALLLVLALNLHSVRLKISTILGCLLFVVLSLLHLVLLDVSGRIPFSVADVLGDYFLYVGLICAYIIFFAEVAWEDLEGPCILFFKVTVILDLALWILAVGAGTSFGVDISYAVPRLHGLLTEPSNVAHFLPALLIYSVLEKRWAWALTCGGAVLLTFSPTVILTVLLTLVVLKIVGTRPLHTLIVLALVGVAVAVVSANFEALLDFLREFGQVGQAVARILEGFSFIASAGGVGANSRADLIFSGVDFMNAHGLWWTGAGFGTSAYIGETFNDGLLFDSDTWFSLVLWFGVLILPLPVFVQYLAVRNAERSFTYILLVSLCVSNTVNGGGVWLQMFFATLLCLKLKSGFGSRTEPLRVNPAVAETPAG